jgi:glycerol-3-phosphate dehydrogenase
MIDVVVIGAGISGAAVAYQLAKYRLNVVVLDKEHDVSCGTTKANSAIIHAGYDAPPGSLMARFNVLGNALYESLCYEIDAPFRRTGSYVLAFDEEDARHIRRLYERGLQNGVPDLALLSSAEVLAREPHVNPKIVGALYAGSAGVVDPWYTCIKLLENAAENGVDILTDAEVTAIRKIKEGSRNGFEVILADGRKLETRIVLNAAGVYADTINDMVSARSFHITPRIGEYFILDKTAGYLTNSVIFQCPTELGKGILVGRTIHDNIIVGPTALDVGDREYTGNTTSGLEEVKRQSLKSIADINFRDSIKTFAGIRAEADTGDFILGEAPDAPGFFNMAGMKSPGLTSAPAAAAWLADLILENLGNVRPKEHHVMNTPQIRFMDLSAEKQRELIMKNRKYGRIVCRCESITEGEIVDAIRRKVGARTVDGVKRRCRPGSGRCQGGFCGPRVVEILARESGKKWNEVEQDKKHSFILTEETK